MGQLLIAETFQLMKELGLPLGFVNWAPYDLDTDGNVVVNFEHQPKERKRKIKKKKPEVSFYFCLQPKAE